jgi:nitroreductase
MTENGTIQTLLNRRSVRRYTADAIPEADLRAILEATRQAPSAANRQPLHFVVVRDPEQKRRVAQACNAQSWMAQADCIVAGISLPALSAKWHVVDASIALQNLVIAAAGLGYGTCWIGAFAEGAVKDVLGLPEESHVVALTPLGVPAETPASRTRKPFAELFSLDRFGQKLAE